MGPAMTVVGGSAIEALGNRKANKQRRAIMNRAMEDSQRTQQASVDQTLAEAQSLRPDARLQAMNDDAAKVEGQLRQDVAGGVPAPTLAGRPSDAYTRALMTRDAGEADRTSALVRELSRVRAPGNVLQNEALRRSNLAEELDTMWGSTRNRNRAAELDAAFVVPPWWAQAARMGRQFGQSLISAGSGGQGGGK